MVTGKYFMASICLLAGLLAAQPVMAMSEMGKRAQQQAGNTITTGDAGGQNDALPPSLHDFLPGLIGPHLYLHLLQSDQFITLQGLVGSFVEKHIIKTQ